MTNLTDSQGRQVDFLLADFAAIKAEIDRRSTLQRFVLLGYLAIWALLVQQSPSFSFAGPWVVTVWVAAALSFQFYAREGLEISRLGGVISTGIAPIASRILSVPCTDLIPSQTKGDPDLDETRSKRREYNRTFAWAAFFAAPMVTTLWYMVEHRNELYQKWAFDPPTPWATVVVILSAGYAFALLRRHG